MRVRATQGMLAAAAIVDVAFPVTVAILDLVNPALDPVRTTLSRHALRPGFPWMGLAFLIHAAALGLMAWGLRRLPPRPWTAPSALGLAAVATALLAVFADDPSRVETTAGHLHEAFATVAFVGLAAGALFAFLEQRRHPDWAGLHHLPSTCALAVVVLLSGFGLVLLAGQFVDGVRAVYGVAERLVIVGIGSWMLATAVQGVRVAARTRA